MAKLVPIPFEVLVTRLFGELERKQSAFDLSARRFFSGDGVHDLSVSFHGHRASTPFGPAAGPHTQLAQNAVLAWLAGGRIIELKTVQVRDDLVIPRPCIDAATVGLNVEWSQELSLEESLEEYVKASMLIAMLKTAGVAEGVGDTVFDMSVGYDLAGIRSERVRTFLAGMLDASEVVERLRRQIPARWAHLRELSFPTRISDTLTLSTFHGCPPDEIERICEFLLDELGLHVAVKLNPTLLGEKDVKAILHDRLGYRDLVVPAYAFEKDTRWEQVVGFVGRLAERARSAGRGFALKCTNTLIVRNHKQFFPGSDEMYLSGPPLHVLATVLVRQLRRTFGDRHPISFSGGIDALNFPDAAALGLRPVTVCTDLLRPGGYGRAARYFSELSTRMTAVEAIDLDTFAIKAYGHAEAALDAAGLARWVADACRSALATRGDLRAAAGDGFPRWVSAARVLDTETYCERTLSDPRYSAARNATPPKKVGTALALFDCLTCDKCIPVCPNDANFSLPLAEGDVPVEWLIPTATGFVVETRGAVSLRRPRQIANFADACNDCGHCDVMCPEDGGPYVVKPRFFGSVRAWAAHPALDGIAFEHASAGLRVHARFAHRELVVDFGDEALRYRGEGFDVRLELADPAGSAKGLAEGPVDLTWLRIIVRLRDAVVVSGATTWIGTILAAPLAPRAS